MERLDSGRQLKVASNRLLDGGNMSAKKDLGEESGVAALSSRKVLRRYFQAAVGSDLTTPSVAFGEINPQTDPQMGSVFRRPISPVQDFHFQNSTVDGPGFLLPETPSRTTIATPSSGVRRVSVEKEREDMLRRWAEAGESMGLNQPVTEQSGSLGLDLIAPLVIFTIFPHLTR
jgi:hypothetical protein